jgi:hypothetical protein
LVSPIDSVQEWYVAVIDGQVTQITIGYHVGRGKFSVREDKLNRFDYRIIDASDIICLARAEKSELIIDALFSGHSQAHVHKIKNVDYFRTANKSTKR